ncbi:cache domain-containing sensor histidine kinase [Cohnella zeiphila]|uniref:Sensor histidine kinase n=1 Tax=Cohnella zeiphila TaxID=2761120 RepID=A0A7X0STZ5_9BACL|nr:sensor histidine kinase [Cohnella zeiphila]MBB6735956.1 sensor histidine kinase [Cohnella zeiphila]
MNKSLVRRAAGRIRGFFAQIRTVLFLSYFVIILLCITIVGAVSFFISYRSMSERVESAGSQIVQQIQNNMDNDFHSKRNMLLAPYYEAEYTDGISAYPEMTDQQKFLFRQKLVNLFLKSFNITPIQDFIRFQIYFSDGSMLGASDDYKPWSASQVRSADWYLRTVAKDGIVLFSGPNDGDGHTDTKDTAYSSSMLIRMFASPERFIVVRVEYGDDLFRDIGKKDNLSANSRIVILDDRNKLVYASGDREAYSANADMLARLGGDSGKFWFRSGGDDELVSYVRSSYSGWKTVLIMPRSDIFGPLNRIKTTVVWTALIVFIVTFLISVLFGRSITRPILNLYKTVNRVKRGDFSERVEVTRNDEIGRIAMNFNAMQDELQTLIETKYVNQIKLQEVELAMLYSQINPHFLYNTLDSIRAMADYYRVSDIGDMAQALADMFRYNTRNKDEVVTLQEEAVQIDAYMKIQGIRFEDKIAYELDIEEELYNFPVLKMTLQPLVENAVFHGIERKRGKGTIRIVARRVPDGRVELAVEDDGVGLSERRLEEVRAKLRAPLLQESFPSDVSEGGIGFRNVYARYAIRYGDRMEMSIDSRKGFGTRASLLLPDERALPDGGKNLLHSGSGS